ncbi:hypothetical protein MKZ38_006534 [Zalerion maritima]|uniref:Uncharacterized protein n=1 Tax=Zalerion maritima TaxID=339359 RepID=A0AAD5WY66_9PEZI|nr:hypothetical protein MKZ38_006534 [Zalerion maritima]
MSTETTGFEAHHDDGLDIDFGLGAPQETIDFSLTSNDIVPGEHNQISSKGAGTDTNLEVGAVANNDRAPSEINYDTDADDDQSEETPAEAPHDNDEINWDDDGDDDKVESCSHGVNIETDDKTGVENTEGNIHHVGDNLSHSVDENVDGAAVVDAQEAGAYKESAHNPEDEAHNADAGVDNYIENDINEASGAVSMPHAGFEYELENPGNDVEEEIEVVTDNPEIVMAHSDEHQSSEGAGEELETIEIEDGEDDDMCDETLAVEADEDDLADAEELGDLVIETPEVQVLFAGNEYSLFRDPNDADKPYILEDSLFRARASELLDALHDALGDEINDGDELVVQVQDLCLEISPMMASTLQSMSISDFAHLHAKLVSNDQPEDPHPLRLTIVSKPSFSSRYQELLAGVNQGIGWSQVRRQFDTGQGVVYTSPIKNELGDIEYANDDMEYEQSGNGEEDEEKDVEEEDIEGEERAADSSESVSAASGDDNSQEFPDHADADAGYDDNAPEDDNGYYTENDLGDNIDEGTTYEEKENHAEEGNNDNELMQVHDTAVEMNFDQQHARGQCFEPGLELNAATNLEGEAAMPEPVESTTRSGQDDDDIDWADDEPTDDGAHTQTGTEDPLLNYPCTKHLGNDLCVCFSCVPDCVRTAKSEVESLNNLGYSSFSQNANKSPAHDMDSNMDVQAPALQTTHTGFSRNTTPSVTIDGDNEADVSGIDLNVDVGLEVLEDSGLTAAPHAPALDEISWEGDEDGGGEDAGNIALESQSLPPTANSNGKRQRPGDESEMNRGDGTVDVKRRRSS